MPQPLVTPIRKSAKESAPEVHTDPVCKMLVTFETAAGKHKTEDITYYFCSPGCRERFAADPGNYLLPPDASDQPLNVEYTCPMHPEIVQIGPGSCPICGMALEPSEISLDDTPDPEYIYISRRFWVCAVLTLPVFLLSMGEISSNLHSIVSPSVSIWIQFVLSTPVVLWGGFPFFKRALSSIKNASPNMFTLIVSAQERHIC